MTTPRDSSSSQSAAIAEIRELLAAYCWALDRREFEQLRNCFTKDAHAEYSGVRLDGGVDAIIEHVSGLRHLAASQHIIGSVSIQIDGPTAVVRSHAVAHLVRAIDEGAHEVIQRGLTYDDVVVQTQDGWRIAERVHHLVWMTIAPTTAPMEAW